MAYGRHFGVEKVKALSGRMRTRVAEWDGTVVAPRPAASVLLLRPAATTGLETFMMRRPGSMAFAAGMSVFPGGSVHPSDADPAVPWRGPPPAAWAERLGCSVAPARSLVVAAVRETFEETGVLLASAASPGTSPALDASVRAALERGEVGLGEVLRSHGLELCSELLAPWQRWITPEFEARRYDTQFFLARLPAGQQIGALASEAEHGHWVAVAEAYRAGAAGEVAMMRPTLHNLQDLLRHRRPFAAAAERSVPLYAPRLVEIDGEWWLDGPDERVS